MFAKVEGVQDTTVLSVVLIFLLFLELILGYALYEMSLQFSLIGTLVMTLFTVSAGGIALLGILNICLPEEKYNKLIQSFGLAK
jgi:hypothetical protein